ncbi:TadE/TadG family type IV pilus assembly protein [Ideonella sp. YS5]|uniref:TadE/TadG family type IV pilus assembly protein n=1 Tax=Ideonella sp. YS5 TaxID=3453714 RepID=UPI003EED3271
MRRHAHGQRGVAAVEFALVCGVFFTLLLGVVEMGRLLWTWNAATEATRLGARVAAVCDLNEPHIKTQMIGRLPSLTASNIVVTYLNPPAADNTCTISTCKAVRVSLTGYEYEAIIPFVPLTLDLPAFTTTLRREHMQSSGNSVCS